MIRKLHGDLGIPADVLIQQGCVRKVLVEPGQVGARVSVADDWREHRRR